MATRSAAGAVRAFALASALLAPALAGLVLAPMPVSAQGIPLPGKNTASSALPVAIEADNGVEWRQNDLVYIARGNATAKRGDTTIRADTLTAHYIRTKDNRQEITKLVAEGAVKIVTAKETITSDTAEYVVQSGVFTLVGRPVRIDNEKNVLTAPRVVYNNKERIANVLGGAQVTEEKEKRRVNADRLVAYFKDDKGKNALKKVDAIGNVVITTPSEIARGEKGDYDADTRIATLTGNVRLTRGENQLNGDRAVVNMKTGVSTVAAKQGPPSANPAKGERVRVLIVPGEDTKSLDIPSAATDNTPGAKKKK